MSEMKEQYSGANPNKDFNLLNCQIFLDKILPDQNKDGSWQITVELVAFAFRFRKVKKGMDWLLELKETWDGCSPGKFGNMSTEDLYKFFCGEDFTCDGIDPGPSQTKYMATELVVSLLNELLNEDRFWRTPVRMQALENGKRFLKQTKKEVKVSLPSSTPAPLTQPTEDAKVDTKINNKVKEIDEETKEKKDDKEDELSEEDEEYVSKSLLCDDSDCSARFQDGRSYNSFFTCYCLDDEDFKGSDWENNKWGERINKLIDDGILTLYTSTDPEEDISKDDVRLIHCGGMRCGACWEEGLHVHCQGCFPTL